MQTLWNFRIQQLREARVVHHALKVIIGARLEAVFRVQVDGFRETIKTILRLASNGIDHRKPVESEIRFRMVCQQAFQLRRCFFKIAGIDL